MLPIRVDNFSEEIPELSTGIGYLEISSNQSEKVVNMVLKKLGRKEYDLNSTQAYKMALHNLEEFRQGFLTYNRILTSIKTIKKKFEKVIPGEVHGWLGHHFFWKRSEGKPLILYAKNEELKELKELGLVEICKFQAPEAWIGTGMFRIAWPDVGKSDRKENNPETLVVLYIVSSDPIKFNDLVANLEENPVFLAALYLDEENSQVFYQIAEERYGKLL